MEDDRSRLRSEMMEVVVMGAAILGFVAIAVAVVGMAVIFVGHVMDIVGPAAC